MVSSWADLKLEGAPKSARSADLEGMRFLADMAVACYVRPAWEVGRPDPELFIRSLASPPALARQQVLHKPVRGQNGCLFECPGFFKEVGGSLDKFQPVGAAHQGLRLAVEFDDPVICAADNQEGGCADKGKPGAGQVRSAPS